MSTQRETRLKIDHSTENQSEVVLILSGDLDIQTAPKLRRLIESVINEGNVNLRLDLSKLSYLDSSGYGVLVDANRKTRATHGSLKLTKLPPWMQEFFDLAAIER